MRPRPPVTPGWVYAFDGLGTHWCPRCGRLFRDPTSICTRCGASTEKIR